MPEDKNQVAIHIVELIKAQHWDMAACRCWICEKARAAGLNACYSHLEEASQLGQVMIGEPWKELKENKTDD